MSTAVPEIFGSMVFNDDVMRARLPKDTYKSLKKTIQQGSPLELDVANVVANAMKDWAIEKGATHFTHWFQPLTGVTAEKHDSFISPNGAGVIMEFSGKELVKGEVDGSSFPSGGIRATFEARGYTAWDPTSYAFIKDGSLYIPTAFCSYTGESLDKKTPLLRSMEALNTQALRILRLFGNTSAKRVTTTVGPEQEYFLIDKKLWEQRKDLIFTGRTLFGSMPPKGQEMDDHYYGSIKPRIADFMADLDNELWKLGILSKTKHNEVAPAQHEMAPIFTTTNLSADQNQLTMQLMKQVALKHGLYCLLAEKPFAGVNGSGKHNNWSMSTDDGFNLLEPGETPRENAQFLLILTAVIQAVDKHQDLLRDSVASAGNDHRLGANEAPPAIISMFIGDELQAVLDSIENGSPYSQKTKEKMQIGVSVLPAIPKDTTDRNRTSPFAFTGNKFEFRSLGSSLSISGPNVVLNTIVAETLDEFATRLEKSSDLNADLQDLIKEKIIEHKKIIFNGNGYDDEWVKEAEKRGLLNLRTLPDAMERYLDPQNVEMFAKYGVYSESEMKSHHEVKLEKYSKVLNIEVNTMLDMIYKDILPASYAYMNDVAESASRVMAVVPNAKCSAQANVLKEISALADRLDSEAQKLAKLHKEANAIDDVPKQARFYVDKVIPQMEATRLVADSIEPILGEKYKPFPSYADLLFRV
ncbi:glutamine synthetase III family protein [Treponema ruminis]|uniref:Glutamine synthetase n=1 Tax=Treponema ruminis TaxID=744515 RepID=A0A7W8G739_9SPIR|nr:glutamine synthetase III [Treponema ruminis]MBB5225025.1 glutamine synthetase [Treponema ruminis]